jgi:hypothetical protein
LAQAFSPPRATSETFDEPNIRKRGEEPTSRNPKATHTSTPIPSERVTVR